MLDRITSRQWRLLLLLLLTGYFSVIALSNLFLEHNEFWRYLGVERGWPVFADLRSILAGLDCKRLGYDVLQQNPCDPWQRPMLYPRLWLSLRHFGLSESHSFILGSISVAVFTFLGWSLARPLGWRGFLVWAGAILSPAVMLGVERANNEILIYSAVIVALFIPALPVLLPVLVMATALKLYPFLGLPVLMTSRRPVLSIFLLVAMSAVYVALTWDDITLILRAIPHGIKFENGLPIVRRILLAEGVSAEAATATMGAAGLLLLTAVAAARGHRRIETSAFQLRAFLVGASIFVGTYVVGSSIDYRLVWLLLAIPYLQAQERWPLLGLLVMCLWFSRISAKILYLDEALNWVLAWCLIRELTPVFLSLLCDLLPPGRMEHWRSAAAAAPLPTASVGRGARRRGSRGGRR